MCQTELRRVRSGLLMLALLAGWIPVHAHLVTFRVHMPDPAMEAVVEVNASDKEEIPVVEMMVVIRAMTAQTLALMVAAMVQMEMTMVETEEGRQST